MEKESLGNYALGLFPAHSPATAQTALPADIETKIDEIAAGAVEMTGIPSASIAIVRNSGIVYVKTYGRSRLDPETLATSSTRYRVGSISKQFAASAILLLQEQGKLSLGDKVGKFIPDLTRANEVTIRQLLSHTSGYQDYWPQDYVMPMMLEPVSASRILEMWAHIPLDFDPGTKWEYSNTNYVFAGIIVEKATCAPLFDFLREKIFTPLKMASVTDAVSRKLGSSDATGYVRYALGPLRPAQREGTGWLFATGDLAMTAQDLARWDISVIDQTVLRPASYHEFETEILLQNGASTHYALGIAVGNAGGHRMFSHSGGVSGFTAQNFVLPDDKAALVVLTNQDTANGSGVIANAILPLLLQVDDLATLEKLERARRMFAALQRGTIDRSLFTDNANSYFSPRTLKDFADSLGSLGPPKEFVQTSQSLRGGMTFRSYRIALGEKTLELTTAEMPSGKLEQCMIVRTGPYR